MALIQFMERVSKIENAEVGSMIIWTVKLKHAFMVLRGNYSNNVHCAVH